jgi:hypothetical protein
LHENGKQRTQASLPAELTEEGIIDFILTGARDAASATRARFQADQDANLRIPASEKVAALEKLNDFFDDAFTRPLAADEIPYKLLDAKHALKSLRTRINDIAGISFSDREIIESFEARDIPSEIQDVLAAVLSLFVRPRTKGKK